jgi:Putative transmembrane protein (PGPGW)
LLHPSIEVDSMAASSTSSSAPVRERHTGRGPRPEQDAPSGQGMGKLIQRAWRAFRDDEQGQRFRNHHRRLHEPGWRKLRILALFAAPLLLAAGVVMLFVPGPGLLFVLFGLALLAGESTALARRLDRAEPPVRRRFERVQRLWKRLRPRP